MDELDDHRSLSDGRGTALGRSARAVPRRIDPRHAGLQKVPAAGVRTGTDAGGGDLLETSVPGVYAAGDGPGGSTKRCAAAVGEGAMVVQFVHARMSRREKARGRWTGRRSEVANRNHHTMGARE